MTERPDVLFVVLDSLRSDHVSAYGYDRETTPALDRFAESATRYDSAYVPAPWTLPSHCSMFTGALPSEHGVTNGFTDRDLTLSEEEKTVTEHLSRSGYRTGGFSNNPWVGTLSGLDRGFDRFVEWDLEVTQGTPPRRRDRLYSRVHRVIGRATRQPLVLIKRRFFTRNLVDRAGRWIDQSDAPTFAFLNLMEAHSPYYPPDWAFKELGLATPGVLEPRSLNTKLLAYVLGKRSLTEDERERVHEFLDASVRFQDRQFRRLLSKLREAGRFRNALIVVCADHGKTLGEFDREGTPPHYLRDLNVRVPLLVKRPGQREAERVGTPVELADLPDLLLGGSLDHRPDGAVFEDYLPHTASGSSEVTRWRGLADGQRKYLRREDGQEYLLRGVGLDEQVAEAVEDDELEQFRDRLGDRVSGLELSAPREGDGEDSMDPEVESQLHDLGYLG